jgi:hypothetical protein
MSDDSVQGGTFFQKALAQIKPPHMKFLVVLVVGLLMAPQAVRGYDSPTLALVIIVIPFVIFAVCMVALEFRDRQVSDLYKENENLKELIRQLNEDKKDLKALNRHPVRDKKLPGGSLGS